MYIDMAVYTIKVSQQLPISLEHAWDFISSPYNLQKITPAEMNFKILNGVKPEDKMHAGQVIVYSLTPLLGIRTEWVTEITHMHQHEYFIDEQRFGPYSLWHHMHSLKAIDGGVQMDDVIHYKLPFGILGQLIHFVLIRKKLKTLFDYRRITLEKLFGKM
ncbi:MAG: SRPBCC family protein [Bacteroidota bacterium]